MKTKVLLAVGMLLGTAAFVQAATIAGSKHDLTTGALVNSVGVSGTNQTCVFCHAPHNALVNKLLWNRKNTLSGATFKIFTSFNSTQMRNAGTMRTTLSDSSTSLLCLSCHSLTTAAQLVTNTNTVTGATLADATNGTGAARWAATTGNMLNITNDHPVGINYKQYSDTDATALEAPDAATLGFVKNAKVRLFTNAVTGPATMECATCHSVHDPTNGKFLAITNAASALCINCHKK
jgi:predicted CXXCH cytochrome family protein